MDFNAKCLIRKKESFHQFNDLESEHLNTTSNTHMYITHYTPHTHPTQHTHTDTYHTDLPHIHITY